MTIKKRVTIRADKVQKDDDILIQAEGCDPQVIGTALGDSVVRRGFAKFRVGTGIHSWTRHHWPDTMIIVERQE